MKCNICGSILDKFNKTLKRHSCNKYKDFLDKWLSSIGMQRYYNLFYRYGFDIYNSIALLKEESSITMGIIKKDRVIIMNSILNFSNNIFIQDF